MRIEWNPSLILGNEQIDMQHQELFVRINQLLEAHEIGKREDTEKVLNFLRDYVIFHFSDEEEVMRRTGYPQVTGHLMQHKEFKEQLESLREKLLSGDRDVAVGAQTKAWLVDWWIEHINRVDRMMVEFLLHHPASGTGAALDSTDSP